MEQDLRTVAEHLNFLFVFCFVFHLYFDLRLQITHSVVSKVCRHAYANVATIVLA